MLNNIFFKKGKTLHTEAGYFGVFFFFFSPCKQKLEGAICPPRRGEEGRSWGVHGVRKGGIKGGPFADFQGS